MNNAFVQQIEFLVNEARDGHMSMHELMKLIESSYKDYLEFHPEELPEYYNYYGNRTDVRKQNNASH